MEERVSDLICAETSAPKRRPVQSHAALYTLMLLLAVGVIVLSNVLGALTGVARMWFQLPLYGVLLLLFILANRYVLCGFRYTLTTRSFMIERVIGQRQWEDAGFMLSAVCDIRPYAQLEKGTRATALYTGRRAGTLAVTVEKDGQRQTVLISPSAEMTEKLIQAWKNSAR